MNYSFEKPRSTELTAVSGFTYEDRIAGFYLASLMAEAGAPTRDAYVVARVSFQQSSLGHLPDDHIIDENANDGSDNGVMV